MNLDGLPDFEPFPKVFRWSREIIITEKIDGTNALVHVLDDGRVLAGSRNGYLDRSKPASDNFGFGRWVEEHEEELRVGLGPGRHFGEWWGAGIQRRYGLDEKRFSLFNVSRWDPERPCTGRPACCHVVPVLYKGQMDEEMIFETIGWLKENGSAAALGFANPEGIVVFHVPSGYLFKKTIKKDDEHKGQEVAS